MRRTFSTYMPEEAGALERAAEVVSSEGADIVRLSYNRAVDAHTVFIEAEGSEEQIERIKQRFNAMGYFDGERNFVGVVLFEFNLPDGTNDIRPLLRLIKRFGFNISYVSAGSAEGNRQTVKMGLLVENNEDVSPFINRAAELCSVKVLDYDKSSKTLDNTVFYLSFAGDIARKMRLDERSQRLLTVNANFIMQILEDKGIAPHATFEQIGNFADCIMSAERDFNPRVTRFSGEAGAEILLVEPPCGSNTCVLSKGQGILAIDGGFECFANQTLNVLRMELPGFDAMDKSVCLTHADVDHCGLLNEFDEIILNKKCHDQFEAELSGGYGFRERIPGHKPYVKISAILSGYHTPDLRKMRVLGGKSQKQTQLLEYIGTVERAGFSFEVYEGIGGHIDGECVFVERNERLVFTGDLMYNVNGFTKEQMRFNKIAPFLLSSVDSSVANAAMERRAILSLLTPGKWTVFGGHGAPITQIVK